MAKPVRLPNLDQQQVLQDVRVTPASSKQLARIHRLLEERHYLGSLKPVGERLYYVATTSTGEWLAVLVFSSASNHLKLRDQWIGWTSEQRRRRLSLIVNNCRFLLLPGVSVPNLGSRILRLTLDRLSQDWQERYGHPVLVVETFVDPEQFCGTVYSASGWSELGQTEGWGRCRRDYYVKHDKPKRLFVRPLTRNACRNLQAEQLKPNLAMVETKVPPRCTTRIKEICSIVEHFKKLPEYRGRVESYPLFSIATIIFLAVLCGAPRGQTDLEKFAQSLSDAQRRSLGIRRNPRGKYPAPSQPTFSRFLAGVDVSQFNERMLDIQKQLRGPAPKDEVVVMDGKEPNHGSGASILTAVTVPSQYYLGCAVVDQKTNEIPVAQELIPPLDLEGRLVSLDALHTQDETARRVVMEAGGDYLLTVKKNQPTLWENVQKKVTAPEAGFPPCAADADTSPHL